MTQGLGFLYVSNRIDAYLLLKQTVNTTKSCDGLVVKSLTSQSIRCC